LCPQAAETSPFLDEKSCFPCEEDGTPVVACGHKEVTRKSTSYN